MFDYRDEYYRYDFLARRELNRRKINWERYDRYSMLASIMHHLACIQNGKRRGRCAKKMRSYYFRLQYARERYRRARAFPND
jgi:hypothetical protein